ncbi:hypothetical protein [Maribacter flavus]|uniref:Uncharacterized protein n=1 Tax=Maribacter flavus TaxID=1658664 RepID=A0A5B2TVW5_9FLAO|nr:hypothetical protein [Maribacter flavus]KAA2218263.1 hypothetical protein F0361_01185 [Maribacter flavus]
MCCLANEHELIPFRLRDHLVPFLFNEFKCEEAVVMPRLKTKAIKLHKTSSICRLINMVHSKYEENTHLYDYRIQFSIRIVKGGKKYDSALFKTRKDEHELLQFTEYDNNYINGFFEDIFRTAFIFYVNGSKQFTSVAIKEVINDFMDEYDLLELGFDTESLRILYYRETGKENKLTRFQHKSSNRVNNY